MWLTPITDATGRQTARWSRLHSMIPTGSGGGGSSTPAFHATGTRPSDPIALADGSLDFGAITPEIAQATKPSLTAAPIRLLVGAHQNQHRGFGAAHIKAQHGNEILRTGLSIPAFVQDTLAHYQQIWKQTNGRLALVRTGRHGRVAVIELQSKSGFYSVVTAYTRIPEIRMEGTLIWSGRTTSNARNGMDALEDKASPPDPDFQRIGSPGPSAGAAPQGALNPGIEGLENQINDKRKLPPPSQKSKPLKKALILFFIKPAHHHETLSRPV